MNRRIALLAATTALICAAAMPLCAQDKGGEITVFAAASLQNAFEDLGRLHQQRSGRPVKFSFAASSALARQIEQGAPAAVFASADEQWMDYLAQRKLIVAETRKPLLGNRLVLVVPTANTAKVELKPGFALAALLGKDGRWVTGDPSNVPVGRYAQEAFTKLGAWDFVQSRLVRAENVRVALAFVERGEAVAGVVYETDAALSKKVRVAAVFPNDSHTPISYPVAVVARSDTPAARDFLRTLESPEAREIFRKYGFTIR